VEALACSGVMHRARAWVIRFRPGAHPKEIDRPRRYQRCSITSIFAPRAVDVQEDKEIAVLAESLGRPRHLAVLDLDKSALAGEAARLSSIGTFAIEVVDRATWIAMRRLESTGLLQFTQESRLLHRCATLREEGPESAFLAQRAAQLMGEAQRAVRMAKVLASGGLPEEVPALLAKVLQKAGAARMVERAELPAGSSSATDADIRRLVECDALPVDALNILDASRPGAGLPPDDAGRAVLAVAERFLGAVGKPVPIEARRRAA
jgi:hypothetical protein